MIREDKTGNQPKQVDQRNAPYPSRLTGKLAKGLPEPASLSVEFWQHFSPHHPVLDEPHEPQVIEAWDTRLEDALQDLREVCQEARGEEYPEPTSVAVERAHRLLKAMFRLSPRRFEVYPTPDGEVALDAFGGTGRSVLVLCEADGSVFCLVNFHGEHRRARYASCKSLPDGFVREALLDL